MVDVKKPESKTEKPYKSDPSPLDALALALLVASVGIYRSKKLTATSIPEFSRNIFFVAVFFWAWAAKNTLKSFDLGIISFFFVSIATFLHWRTERGSIGFTRFAIGFVLFNYVLGGFIGHTVLKRRDFVTYCAVNLGFWSVILSKY